MGSGVYCFQGERNKKEFIKLIKLPGVFLKCLVLITLNFFPFCIKGLALPTRDKLWLESLDLNHTIHHLDLPLLRLPTHIHNTPHTPYLRHL